MFIAEVNCFSHVYYESGIDREEKFRFPQPLQIVLNDFDIVPESQATVIAVVPALPDQNVIHLALLDQDMETITHRPDVDLGVTTDAFPDGLADYLAKSSESRIVYLARTSTSKK